MDMTNFILFSKLHYNIYEKIFNSDGQQFRQYIQNKQLPLASIQCTQKRL